MVNRGTISVPGLELAGKELEEVEKILRTETRSEVRLVIEVSDHILGSGGKRFRPLLTLLCGRLTGLKRKRELWSYAAAMELCHTSTLLHDDVIDEAELRRGRASANRRFGNAPSIIIGDYLLAKAFQLLLRGGKQEVMRLLAGIAVEMAEGEAYQLALKQRVNLSLRQYERIIRSKTALLIQAACQIPAVAAGAPPPQERALAGFGYRLGLAFQISDDLLDYTASDAKWGKQVGKDFLEGKTTLPLILAYQQAGPADKKFIADLFRKPRREPADFPKLKSLLLRHRAFERSRAIAEKHLAAAKSRLQVFPVHPARRVLEELADFVVQRPV